MTWERYDGRIFDENIYIKIFYKTSDGEQRRIRACYYFKELFEMTKLIKNEYMEFEVFYLKEK